VEANPCAVLGEGCAPFFTAVKLRQVRLDGSSTNRSASNPATRRYHSDRFADTRQPKGFNEARRTQRPVKGVLWL
jgi:hypothetical protein